MLRSVVWDLDFLGVYGAGAYEFRAEFWGLGCWDFSEGLRIGLRA